MKNHAILNNRLGKRRLLFPICLVLYEFSTYIGNDMIQPGMISVVEKYNAGSEWIPTSMTAYLAGGMFLQWLLGPLSDRVGRRPVMLIGIVWFIVTCLTTLLAQTIEQFTILRFLQGISLCFISAVGYTAIQESFEETICIRLTALMANVALIAPLLGPLMGAVWIHIAPWEWMFILFAVLAIISFIGIYNSMPETATRIGEKLSFKTLSKDYIKIFKNTRFIMGAFALGFISLPLITWISQSPIIVISTGQLSSYEYGLLQIPIFGSLIIGNILLTHLAVRYSIRSIIIIGKWPIIIGLLISATATVVSSHILLWMIIGLSIYAFGMGLVNSGLLRLTLFTSNISKGTVSAAMGMLQMLIFTFGIEISKYIWTSNGNVFFNLFNLINGIIWIGLTIAFLRENRDS